MSDDRGPADLAGGLALALYYAAVAAACVAAGYYLPAGVAVLASMVLFLALSALTILVVMLEAGLSGQAGPRPVTASIGVGLTAITTVGGCALGATLQ